VCINSDSTTPVVNFFGLQKKNFQAQHFELYGTELGSVTLKIRKNKQSTERESHTGPQTKKTNLHGFSLGMRNRREKEAGERVGALLLLGVVILSVLSLLHPEAPVLQSLLRPPRSCV